MHITTSRQNIYYEAIDKHIWSFFYYAWASGFAKGELEKNL
jgi:hypothetical protein